MALLVAAIAVLSSVSTGSAANVSKVTVGFSFSPAAASALGLDPTTALDRLLKDLRPDVVRIPIYWSDVEANPDVFDFSVPDQIYSQIAAYNASTGSQTQVIPVVGMRNLGYPELHTPLWVDTTSAPSTTLLADSDAYAKYLTTVVTHYRSNPLTSMWQLENEPLDDVTSWSAGPVSLDQEDLADDRALLQRLDPGRQVMITTYDSSTAGNDQVGLDNLEQSSLVYPYVGHPDQVLRLGDILGLDLYVATDSTDLVSAPADVRVTWKATSLALWQDRARQAGKQVWISELQAAPWPNVAGFTSDDLVRSAIAYRDAGATGVLMWGVESWLVYPDWMAAGKQAMQIFGHVTPAVTS